MASLLAVPAVGGAGLGAREAARWWRDQPADLPLERPLPQRSVLYARDGRTVIATFYGENRLPVRLADLPPDLVAAVLAVEDDRYYDHGAVDVRGTLRAVVNNAGGGFTQGGSTITQQYVKNLLLTEADSPVEEQVVTERTLVRKLREARLAVEAERRLGKDGVLEALPQHGVLRPGRVRRGRGGRAVLRHPRVLPHPAAGRDARGAAQEPERLRPAEPARTGA